MKQIFIVIILLFSLSVFSQQLGKVDAQNGKAVAKNNKSFNKRAAITVGHFQGGGSLVGVDYEVLVGEKFGLQLGAGLVAYGASVNYHFKSTIRSSFISLSYWHQGVGFSTRQELLGPSFVYRGKKWFTFNLGVGFQLVKGEKRTIYNYDKFIFNYDKPVQLTAGIGYYFAH